MGPMDPNEAAVERYREQERMMILLFAQWCVDRALDPHDVYRRAYPDQSGSELLEACMPDTLPAGESEPIDDMMLIEALGAFGNDDLAFAVSEEADKLRGKRRT